MRLSEYDYSQAGAYFITICTRDRAPLLGRVHDGSVQLTAEGRIAQEEWLRTPDLRPYVVLDEYVVMPNHVHGILFITDRTADGAHTGALLSSYSAEARTQHGNFRSPSHNVGAIVRGFKAATTSRVRKLEKGTTKLWQREYFDHVIRNDQDMARIREYILNNALRWELDRFFLEQGV
jgi:REP element-mobilizing transposase RayT